MDINIPTQDVVKQLAENKISKDEAIKILAEQEDDMLQAHGSTYRCDLCSYTRHVNCPAYCS